MSALIFNIKNIKHSQSVFRDLKFDWYSFTLAEMLALEDIHLKQRKFLSVNFSRHICNKDFLNPKGMSQDILKQGSHYFMWTWISSNLNTIELFRKYFYIGNYLIFNINIWYLKLLVVNTSGLGIYRYTTPSFISRHCQSSCQAEIQTNNCCIV